MRGNPFPNFLGPDRRSFLRHPWLPWVFRNRGKGNDYWVLCHPPCPMTGEIVSACWGKWRAKRQLRWHC